MKMRGAAGIALAGVLAFAAVLGAFAKDDATGTIFYEIESALPGKDLPTRIVVVGSDGLQVAISGSLEGRGTLDIAPGTYDVHIYVFSSSVPLLVDVQKVTVEAGDIVPLTFVLKEGIGSASLDVFDKDWDGVLDRVELDAGTDPKDVSSYPGAIPFPQNDAVMNTAPGWYKGELHCQSKYSGGSLGVGSLIREAKREDLDFLAITDSRTMKHCLDPEFESDDILLIPSYQWGEDGHAAILGPKTYLERWETDEQAMFTFRQVNAQGSVFIVQNPCGPVSPWEWAVPWLHGVEVWQSEWRRWPASNSNIFGRGRYTGGRRFVPPEMASALVSGVGTVNSQALKFSEQYLKNGKRVTAVGGSGKRTRADGALGEPTTYVYALELSVKGILDGIMAGRTFITKSSKGPIMLFLADSDNNGKFDAMSGSVLPLNKNIHFRAIVEGASKGSKNVKVRVMKNGLPIKLMTVDEDPFQIDFEDTPVRRAWYRVDVIDIVNDRKAQAGYGGQKMLATTSPIYAEGEDFVSGTSRVTLERIKIEKSGETVHVLTPQSPEDINPGTSKAP